MRKKFSLSRVDIQVSILAMVVVIVSCTILFGISYYLTYHDMITSLENRVLSISSYVSKSFDIELFEEIQDSSDITNPLYIEAKESLYLIREVTDCKYVYTATFNENGEMIYHIDGLDMTDPDFRYPGDLIEEDFQADLMPSLYMGELVMPDTILHTEWGDVFVAYYPILSYNEHNEILGVIGIEFDASRQYETYNLLRNIAIMIVSIFCFASAVFARYYFKSISNPSYKSYLNTDSLTSLKSRRSFDVDLNNLCTLDIFDHTAIILADLNKLKYVNDTYGHAAGDAYIKAFANALLEVSTDQLLYRIGGDEFIIIFNNANDRKIDHYIERVKAHLSIFSYDDFYTPSASFGYAYCEDSNYTAWLKAFNNADKQMYSKKKEFYKRYQKN